MPAGLGAPVLIADHKAAMANGLAIRSPPKKARMQRKNTVPDHVVQAEMAKIKQPTANP
jgi:hypothetical protein